MKKARETYQELLKYIHPSTRLIIRLSNKYILFFNYTHITIQEYNNPSGRNTTFHIKDNSIVKFIQRKPQLFNLKYLKRQIIRAKLEAM